MFVHRACMSGSDAGVAWRPLMVPFQVLHLTLLTTERSDPDLYSNLITPKRPMA